MKNQDNENLQKEHLQNKIMKENITKSKEIQHYFENYVIDSSKAFSHKDVYAFLTQTGKNELKDFLIKNLPELTMPINLKKSSIIENIVNPIREMDSQKILEIKELMSQYCKDNIKKTQLQEVIDKVDNWNEYYFNLRSNIDIAKALSHQDIYAFFNNPNFSQKNKIKAINNYLPVEKKIPIDISAENLFNKNYIISHIVYPIRDCGKNTEFKTFLSQLYKNENKIESTPIHNSPKEIQKYSQQEFDQYYSHYALNYNTDKVLNHTLVYSYINNPNISSEEKKDFLNTFYKKLNEDKGIDVEKPFINDVKELETLSKNKVLIDLIYPLKENTGYLEEEFKYDIARSFINSREQTPHYKEMLSQEPLDLSNVTTFNIDHLNKMIINESLPILTKLGIDTKPNLTTDDKLLIIKKVNRTPNLISKIEKELNPSIKQINKISL